MWNADFPKEVWINKCGGGNSGELVFRNNYKRSWNTRVICKHFHRLVLGKTDDAISWKIMKECSVLSFPLRYKEDKKIGSYNGKLFVLYSVLCRLLTEFAIVVVWICFPLWQVKKKELSNVWTTHPGGWSLNSSISISTDTKFILSRLWL